MGKNRFFRRCMSFAVATAMALSGLAGGAVAGAVSAPVEIVEAHETTVPAGYIGIYTIDDMYNIANDLSGKYILMNDIDMDETKEGGEYDTGHGWTPIQSFNGTLDGNGYCIENLHIRYVDEEAPSYVGLFGDCNGMSVVKNLGLVDVDIRVDKIDGDSYPAYCKIGALAGYLSDCESCYVTGNIDIRYTSAAYVGGLVAIGRPVNSYSLINIISTSSGLIGGVTAGEGYYGTLIKDSYSVANLTATGSATISAVGGNSYSTNCYYHKDHGTDPNAKPLTETMMKAKSSFTGFDFENTWYIDPYSSYKYPQLIANPMTRVESLEIVQNPDRMVYLLTDTIDLTGAKLKVTYEDGTTVTDSIRSDLVSYTMTPGTTTVTVALAGKTTSFDVVVRREPVEAFVERMYTVALGRTSIDESEIEYWATLLKEKKVDGAAIASRFIEGAEFKNKNYSDLEYSRVLYKTFMDYDNTGWTDKLAEGYSRKWVLAQFVNSQEFGNICESYNIERGYLKTEASDYPAPAYTDPVEAFVYRMYTEALGRAYVDPEEIAFYTHKLKNHEMSGADMANAFCMGAEFEGRGLSNDEYSLTMYKVFMNRDRAAGEAGWVDALDSGYNRKWILAQFVNSTEYTNICREYGIERGYLDVPDSEQMA